MLNLEIGKEYYCAWHDLDKVKVVELMLPDVLVGGEKTHCPFCVPSHALFEEKDENFALEELAFRVNRKEIRGYDLIPLIAKTIKMMKDAN